MQDKNRSAIFSVTGGLCIKRYNLAAGNNNMNWRVILGLLLLLFGMFGLYNVMANAAGVRYGMSPERIEIGCIIWMAVGVFLIVKGTRSKDQ